MGVNAVYPVMLDVTDRLVVIIGGGQVAARKARGLLDAGAKRVLMVALQFREDVPAEVEKISADFESRHLDGASLVFAATDRGEVNAAVVAEARRRGIWVNRADGNDGEPGDFATPAVMRKGAVTVTVATTGSPALATRIRDEIGQRFDPIWSDMAEAMREMRPVILSKGLDARRRRELFVDLASAESMEILSEEGMEGLWRWIGSKYFEFADVKR